MSDAPRSFYIVGGEEYGIKEKYIDILTKYYGKKEEYPNVSALLDMLSVKHIIPLQPALYVVRYDEAFVSSLSAITAQKIRALKFKGSIFCIYQDPKHIAKLDKFLPDYTCIIEPVNPKFIEKYLHSDFPKLDDRSIKVATNCSISYGHARTICKSMTNMDVNILAKMSEKQLAKLFGCEYTATEKEIQTAIACRNFNAAAKFIDSYEGSLDTVLYTILQTMIELEKVITSKYSDSPLKEYAKIWKLEDVYHMFMNTYAELNKLRSNTSTDVKCSLVYLFGLLTFKDIPSVEVMQSDF